MEQLTAKDVLPIAHLSRLALTEEEATRYAKDLGTVLEYASHLPELESRAEESALRVAEDRAEIRKNPQGLLGNAVALDNGYVKVPVILDKSES